MTDIYGRSNDVFINGINADNLTALDETANINLGGGEINLDAAVVLVNGAPISGGGFVVNPMAIDLDANEYSITNAGSVTASLFVKNGGTNQQYLMADGSSLQYSANSGNSNFYLYDNGIDQDPTPPNGYITYNSVEQKLATEIYISHRTRDNIDIEVFFKNLSTLNDVYIQDQSNSDNNITYNITGSPTIVNQAQITIPVNTTSSNGTGSVSFGNGHNILLSFFTNSIETDLRITALEDKTQNINASLIGTDFSNNASFILNPSSSHTFTIRNNAFPVSTAKFSVNNTSVQVISVPLLMNLQRITLLAAPVDPNDAARKVYVDDLITPLQTKTQNQTANTSGTTLTKDTNIILREADADAFLVTGDAGDLKFVVGTTSITVNKNIFMLTRLISQLGNPVDAQDAATKSYVDTAVGGGSGLVPYYRQVSQIVNITTTGVAETIITISPATLGSYAWADTAIGQSRRWTIRGLQNRGTFSGIYTLRIKSGATLTDTFVVPAQGPSAVTNQPFIIDILQVRTGANSVSFYMKFDTVNTGTTGYAAFYTNVNATAGVQPLNISTAWTLTLQSSIASCSINVRHVEVTAML